MRKLFFILAVLLGVCSMKAQEGGLSFSVGADVVSSYVWRGTYQTKMAFQPALGLSIGGFSLSSWASTEVTGSQKEVDFIAGYKVAGLSLAVTDYYWSGENAYKYLDYGDNTGHCWEGTLGYTLPVKSFPLSLSVNTMFAGADKKSTYSDEGDDLDKSNFSTYIEAALPFTVKDIDLSAGLGMTPGKGLYGNQASVVNISLKATKTIKITDGFSLPVFGQVILNPNREDVFFVFGISL